MGQQDTNDRSGYAPTYYPGTGNVAEAQRLTIAQGQTLTAVNLTLLPTQTVRVIGHRRGRAGPADGQRRS